MEDIQTLSVRVPREIILKVAELKKGRRVLREQVVIDAINSAHEAFKSGQQSKDKPHSGGSLNGFKKS